MTHSNRLHVKGQNYQFNFMCIWGEQRCQWQTITAEMPDDMIASRWWNENFYGGQQRQKDTV